MQVLIREFLPSRLLILPDGCQIVAISWLQINLTPIISLRTSQTTNARVLVCIACHPFPRAREMSAPDMNTAAKIRRQAPAIASLVGETPSTVKLMET